MTALFDGIILHAELKKSKEALELAKKVWNPTPWVIDVFMGESENSGGEHKDEARIRAYCVEHFGVQSWPIHDKPANWYRAGFTVYGWTWIGFKTEAMMKKFISDWPDNIKKEATHETTLV